MATYTSSHNPGAHLRNDFSRRNVPIAKYDVRSACVGTALSIVALMAIFVALVAL